MNKRVQQAEATRKRLIDTALRLFAAQGFAATSTREIAREAGVSEGLIFHHFPTKIELLRGVAEHHAMIPNRIKTMMAGNDDEPAASRMRFVVELVLQTLGSERTEARMFRVLLQELLTTPELAALFKSNSDALIASMARYLDSRVAAGELRADLHTETAVRNLMGAVLWFFVTHQHLSRATWRRHAETYLEQTLRQWLGGALAREPTSP